MDYQTSFLFIVLFAMKDVFATESTRPPSEYDVTNHLGDWIRKIFELDESNSKIDSALRKAFASAEYHRVENFEYNLTHEVDAFKSKIIFYDINFYTHEEDADLTKPFSLATRKLCDEKMKVSTEFLRITLEGELRQEEDQPYASFFTTLHFDDFELNAIRIPNDSDDAKYYFDISYKDYSVYHHGIQEDIKYPFGDLSKDQKNELTREIRPLLPLLLRVHINRNTEFSKAFEEIDEVFHYSSDMISIYPDFLKHRELYYYVIPEIPFYGFHLKNVVMQGLANIESLDIDEKCDVFTHTLLVKNIQGSMSLDYGDGKAAPLELSFCIGYLSISIKEYCEFVHVEARSFSVNRTGGSSLTYLQSAMMIDKIETAVASALMPSRTVWKACNMESEIEQIAIANTSNWQLIKQVYGKWIPFSEDTFVPKKPWLVQRIFYYAAGGNFLMLNR